MLAELRQELHQVDVVISCLEQFARASGKRRARPPARFEGVREYSPKATAADHREARMPANAQPAPPLFNSGWLSRARRPLLRTRSAARCFILDVGFLCFSGFRAKHSAAERVLKRG